MNDLISREVAIDALRRAAYWQDAERKIAELPAVNAVPVVFCRECKYFDPVEINYIRGRCKRNSLLSLNGRFYLNTFYTGKNDFCSKGERREENG